MAQPAEFEEKEYEHPLNIELLTDSRNHLWTPGQVFEEYFGIDAAIYATNIHFWKLFNYPSVPNGVVLNDFHWEYIWRRTGRSRPLPTFRTNLLLQTKRPHHRKGNNSKYTKHGISGQYWQFEITDHQQKALEHLHQKLTNRALICYASAAFHTLEDLYSHIKHNKIVDNSTFVQAHRMENHKMWVYNQAGSTGLACSKIEKVTDKGFWDNLIDLTEQNKTESDPLQNLLELEKAVLDVTEKLSNKNPISSEFLRRRGILIIELAETNLDIDEGAREATRAYLTFMIFSDLTNSRWLSIA